MPEFSKVLSDHGTEKVAAAFGVAPEKVQPLADYARELRKAVLREAGRMEEPKTAAPPGVAVEVRLSHSFMTRPGGDPENLRDQRLSTDASLAVGSDPVPWMSVAAKFSARGIEPAAAAAFVVDHESAHSLAGKALEGATEAWMAGGPKAVERWRTDHPETAAALYPGMVRPGGPLSMAPTPERAQALIDLVHTPAAVSWEEAFADTYALGLAARKHGPEAAQALRGKIAESRNSDADAEHATGAALAVASPDPQRPAASAAAAATMELDSSCSAAAPPASASMSMSETLARRRQNLCQASSAPENRRTAGPAAG